MRVLNRGTHYFWKHPYSFSSPKHYILICTIQPLCLHRTGASRRSARCFVPLRPRQRPLAKVSVGRFFNVNRGRWQGRNDGHPRADLGNLHTLQGTSPHYPPRYIRKIIDSKSASWDMFFLEKECNFNCETRFKGHVERIQAYFILKKNSTTFFRVHPGWGLVSEWKQ